MLDTAVTFEKSFHPPGSLYVPYRNLLASSSLSFSHVIYQPSLLSLSLTKTTNNQRKQLEIITVQNNTRQQISCNRKKKLFPYRPENRKTNPSNLESLKDATLHYPSCTPPPPHSSSFDGHPQNPHRVYHHTHSLLNPRLVRSISRRLSTRIKPRK